MEILLIIVIVITLITSWLDGMEQRDRREWIRKTNGPNKKRKTE